MTKDNKFGHFDGSFKLLFELCKSITDCSHSTPKWTTKGKLVIRNFNIKKGRLLLNDLHYTDEKTYLERIKRSKPKSGDLIITREAPMGEVCMIPDDINCCLGQRMVLLKPNENKIDNKYLLYAIQSDFVQKQIQQSNKTGSIVSNLRIPVLENLLIPTFKQNIEKKIGQVLFNLDSKIELNNRINAELEQMAKTIYDYWFVQFDFPISAAYAASVGQPEVEGKPYKSSGGKMVWSEELKREVPEGWEVKKLHQIVSVKKDILQTNNLFSDTAYIGLEHIPRKSFNLSTWEIVNKIDSAKFKFEKHDILFGKIRPYFHKVGICLTSGITSVDCIVLRAKNKEYKGLILQTVFSDEFVDVATNSSTGSKMPRADWNILKDYFVINPNNDLLIKFNNFSNDIFDTMGNLVFENQKLTELRNWLLPMLMNGQVRVGDGEDEEMMGMEAEAVGEYKVRVE